MEFSNLNDSKYLSPLVHFSYSFHTIILLLNAAV